MKPIRFRKNKKSKAVILLASLAVLLMVGVTGTLAYLIAQPDPVINTFTPGKLDLDINETFENNVKTNVSLKNTGNVNAYIRAAIVVTWVKETDVEGEFEVYSAVPVAGVDYEITGMTSNWKQGSDGYYYYINPVAATGSTEYLFTKCELLSDKENGKTPNQPDGYTLSVEILGQSIQADGVGSDGKEPVVLAWGETKGGSVTGVNDNGTLSIATD